MVTEESPLNPRSPYARTKYMIEMILRDFCYSYKMKGIALRYFNPIGADPHMRSGMYDKAPSHILGKLIEVYLGKEKVFKLTGTEWPTRDGSGIKDYIHVWDLANAHVNAVEKFNEIFTGDEKNPYKAINLGTGYGTTAREIHKAFENVMKCKIEIEEAPPRLGDVGGAYANANVAKELLDWQATLSIEEAIKDALEWNKVNANKSND